VANTNNTEEQEYVVKEEQLPRDMISIVCPCCGELVPVELILNAGGINEYSDIVGISEGGYSEKDGRKAWPVLALEVRVDEKKYLDNKLTYLLKRYDEAKAKLISPDL
jgi:hypothetical protein